MTMKNENTLFVGSHEVFNVTKPIIKCNNVVWTPNGHEVSIDIKQNR